jgi:hypothetical protein
LTFLGSDIFTPNNDTIGIEVVDIVGRKQINSNIYDYYMLVKTSVGMDVFRTNDFGAIGNHQLPNFRQYYYTIPNQNPEACRIGMINDVTSPYAGLQIYGTDNSTGYGAHYMVKAYFSGESSCNNNTATPVYCTTSSSHFIDNVTPYGNLSSCPQFALITSEESTFFERCGPDLYLPGGSNMRSASVSPSANINKNSKLGVFPNPTTGKITMKYNLDDKGPVKIGLYSILGQQIDLIEDADKEAGQYQNELNFNSMNLKNGVYFVRLEISGRVETQKIIFEGN